MWHKGVKKKTKKQTTKSKRQKKKEDPFCAVLHFAVVDCLRGQELCALAVTV